MKIIDLTVPLDEHASIYPAKEYLPPEFKWVLTPETDGAGLRYSTDIRLMVHTGTHIDTPKHFNNKSTVSNMSLEVICGEAIVVKLPETLHGPISKEMVAGMIPEEMETAGKRLVLMCGYNNANWGSEEYYTDTAYVSTELAEWIVEKGFALMGLDMLTDGLPGFPVHQVLLNNHVYILECLTNYPAIPEGVSTMTLITAPLPLVDREASPVRAFLIR